MRLNMNRRSFIGGAAMLGATALVSGRRGFAQPSSTLRSRQSALDLPASDPVFTDYANAVAAMHALPATDPRNWWQQAKIHAEHCAHGTGDFLPWHRHYINQFEKICGALIGNPHFALPYWDWSNGRGKIPDPFFDVNELNVTHWMDPGVHNPPNWPDINTVGIRAIAKGDGVQDDPVRGGAFTPQTIQSILNETTFSRFYRRLEGSPHNSGHVVVGFPETGTPGHMGSGLSPLDPLFWLHHCNVDRLWAQWQLAGNTTPALPGDYNGQFVDASQNSVNVTAEEARDFTALGYTYSQFGDPNELLAAAGIINPAATGSWTNAFLAANRINPVTEELAIAGMRNVSAEIGVPTSIPVGLTNLRENMAATRRVLDVDFPSFSGPIGSFPTESMLADFGRPKETTRRIVAQLSGVTATFKRPPVVNVFINCPYLGPETPYADPHYAGTFAFFGAPHAGHHGDGQEFYVDLTTALRNIDLADVQQIKVQLMPLTPGGDDADAAITVGELKIISV